MELSSVALIYRSNQYSPNNVNSDALILRETGHRLEEAGCVIKFYTEKDLQEGKVTEHCIVNMCREKASIEILKHLEDSGHIVVNSGYGIANCERWKMTDLFLKNDIPSPASLLVSTYALDIKDQLERLGIKNCWVKRADDYTIHKEDVAYSRHPNQAQEIVGEFLLRGIDNVVINQHLEGDLMKFYGIKDSPFFYDFYPNDTGHSKFGYEDVNGPKHSYHFNEKEFYDICQHAGHILNVDVFGGDAIISPKGEIAIIDFNDWPSFAPCRDAASRAIAESILNKMQI